MNSFQRIALLGFSVFESQALNSSLRLTMKRKPYAYAPAISVEMCDLLLVDADNPQAIREFRRLPFFLPTVFVGSQPPVGAVAWTMRPISPMHIWREFDALLQLQESGSFLPAHKPCHLYPPPPLEPLPSQSPHGSTHRRYYDSENELTRVKFL